MKLQIKRKITKKDSTEDIVALLLKDRKLSDVNNFLNPSDPEKIPFSDFFSDKTNFKKDFQRVIDLLKEFKKNKRMIIVYTDYDADGITGGAILWETLHLLGFKVMPFVPDRKREGYGLSKKGIDNVKKLYDPGLIITVDHGIVAHDQISYAKSIGIAVIVTDHHQKLDKKHDAALAVFHTDKLSGSGVSYFFSKELFRSLNTLNTKYEILNTNFKGDYLALASIGTIADLVPLVGPSRSVVKYGLEQLSKSKRLGICQLLKEARIDGKELSPYEVGFMIAPRINAFGRLSHAIDALRLLCTGNIERAKSLAKQAGATNKLRQDLVIKAIEEAEKMVDKSKKIIVLSSNKWEEGIIGLIASKMVEKFYCPAVVMTKSDGFYKGSARSIPGFDITKFLREQKELLVDVGGHKAAAGFTIKDDNLKSFIKAAEKKAQEEISDHDLIPKLDVDLELPLEQVTLKLTQELKKLEPYGVGNPRPLFYSSGQLSTARLFGANANHLKIELKSDAGVTLEIIFFNHGNRLSELDLGQTINIVYSPEIDSWDGRIKVRGIGKFLHLDNV